MFALLNPFVLGLGGVNNGKSLKKKWFSIDPTSDSLRWISAFVHIVDDFVRWISRTWELYS
ncbi:hypothetical protein ACSBR1_035943 [Camellia fascicularis]